ncbi:ankyrin, partial [Schizophyllum commune Loenen D]
IITLLLDQPNADVDELSLHDWTPLHHAACNGQLEAAALLIERGANINARERLDKRTPLHLAAEHGHRDLTKFLLDQTETSESQDDRGRTPLYYAAYCASEEGVRTLLELGADATTRAYDGTTPLDEVGRWEDADQDPSRNQRICAMLLQAG